MLLTIILPVFGIIIAGLVMRRYGVVGEEWEKVLNAFVYYVALPALIGKSFLELEWSSGIIKMVLVNSLGTFIFAVAVFIVLISIRRLSADMKAGIFLAALIGNTIYMGFPVNFSAFGQDFSSAIAGAGTAQLMLGLITSIAAIEFFKNTGTGIGAHVMDLIKNPLTMALCAGILLGIFIAPGGAAEPFGLFLGMLGATASPVALFALGSFMSRKFDKVNAGGAIVSAAIALVVFPAFLFAFGKLFGLESAFLGITTTMAAMPVAVTTFVIAERFNVDKVLVGNAIVLSTAASVISIPLFLSIFI